MSYCPECGGETRYTSSTKRYICRSCGLSLTRQELADIRQKNRAKAESEEEKRKRSQSEYLKWWLSKKK